MSIASHKILNAIQELLEEAHHTNGDFQISIPDPTIYNATSIAMQNEYDPDAYTYFIENVEKMNNGQRVIFDLISTKKKGQGGVFSLDAIAGSGKTFLSNLLLAFARRTHKIAIATAMSGIAATLLTLGGTFHH